MTKKLLSLLLALMMMMTCAVAFAEEAEAELEEAEAGEGYGEAENFTIEITFEGYEVEFEDGFTVTMPNEWTKQEAEEGVLYGSEELNQALSITYYEGEVTFEEIMDILVEYYGGANDVTLNGIRWAAFTDEEYDALYAAAVSSTGYYLFTFGPASDEELVNLANQVLATVVNNEAE